MSYYHPECSCGKVLFSQASVTVHRGLTDTPQDQTQPPRIDMPLPSPGKAAPPTRSDTPSKTASAANGTHPTHAHFIRNKVFFFSGSLLSICSQRANISATRTATTTTMTATTSTNLQARTVNVLVQSPSNEGIPAISTNGGTPAVSTKGGIPSVSSTSTSTFTPMRRNAAAASIHADRLMTFCGNFQAIFHYCILNCDAVFVMKVDSDYPDRA